MSLRPTFLGFESMRKAINAAQKSLDITGHNMANINTEGYSRQRLDLFSISTSGGSLRYQTAVGLAGQGVNGRGVTQIRDPFLDKRYRELTSGANEAGTENAILLDIEDALDVIDSDGIKVALEKFKDALQDLSVDSPDRTELANIALQSAKQMVQTLKIYDTKLNQIKDQTEFELDTNVKRVSDIFREIADLNEQIVDSYVASGEIILDGDSYKANTVYGPNELKDKRNLLLDELANYGNIKVINNDDGSINVEFAGNLVVENKEYVELTWEKDVNGCALLNIVSEKLLDPIPVEIGAGGLNSGALKGYLDMYNGAGCYADDDMICVDPGKNNFTDECGIVYYQKVIDAFAQTIGTAFNGVNQIAHPVTGDMMGIPMFSTKDGSDIFTAENIQISDEWINDPDMIIYPLEFVKDDAGNITGVKPKDMVGEELDNTQVNKLKALFEKKLGFTIGPDAAPDRTCTLEEYIEYYSVKLGQQAEYQSGVYDSNATMVGSIEDARDSVMSVNLDDEGINMMNFQKWFNASSRMMTTLDEALDTIINNMGLVGR